MWVIRTRSVKMPYHKEAPPKAGLYLRVCGEECWMTSSKEIPLHVRRRCLKPCALSTLEVGTSSRSTKATAEIGNQPISAAVLFAVMGTGVLGVCLAVVFAPLLTWENVRGPLVRVGGGCRREHYNQGCQRGHYKFLTETHHETMISRSGSHPEN